MQPTQAAYPLTRFRRLRRTPALRSLVQESTWHRAT
jgi:delta-aminolevulinic acid dehydratase/porphobilinogen synthase